MLTRLQFRASKNELTSLLDEIGARQKREAADRQRVLEETRQRLTDPELSTTAKKVLLSRCEELEGAKDDGLRPVEAEVIADLLTELRQACTDWTRADGDLSDRLREATAELQAIREAKNQGGDLTLAKRDVEDLARRCAEMG